MSKFDISCSYDGYSVILILQKGNEVIHCTYHVYGHDTDMDLLRFTQIMAGSIGRKEDRL